VTRFARWVVMSPAVWVVALADLGGAIAGFSYWYGATILAAPWYYWIFVPDCPLAALLMGIALLAYHFGRRWDFIGVLAVGTCLKYGLWTVVSWSVEFSRGGPFTLEGVGMTVTHLILFVQGLLLAGLLRYRVLPVVVASLYLVGNDLADYAAGQYPRLPELVGVGLMKIVAICSTAAILAYWAVATWVSTRRARASGARASRAHARRARPRRAPACGEGPR
jgi:uncharacterized membrane protein YpjA